MNLLYSEPESSRPSSCDDVPPLQFAEVKDASLYPANYPDEWWDDPTHYAWEDIVDER